MDINKDIELAVKRILAKSVLYKPFYDYYEGRHQLNFASEKFKNKFGIRLQTLRENLCRTVIKAPASRLEIIGFQTDAKDVQKAAWDIWKRSKMPLHSGAVHRESLKTGDAYVIVWTDLRGKARFYPQLASNITVWKDGETGEITKAAKMWMAAKHYYLTLYYPDRIEKYVSRQENTTADFIPRIVDGEEFPLKNDFGRVPVFHFKTDEELQEFGTSLLTDVIPLNDALNKSLADIFGAQEENMRRRRYVAGMQVEMDEETGKKINPFKPDDDVWIAEEATTKFGEFSDADLAQMLAIKQECVRDIAVVSGTPPSYFNLDTTNFPSGEALRKIEARFTAIVQDAQRSFGEGWGGAMSFALLIETPAQTEVEIETQWTDAAPVSETENLTNALMKLSLGWSIEHIQRDFGLSDEQITKMLEENSSREQAKMQTAAKFFDAGNTNLN